MTLMKQPEAAAGGRSADRRGSEPLRMTLMEPSGRGVVRSAGHDAYVPPAAGGRRRYALSVTPDRTFHL
ncbi:MAG: hypothetical protein LBD24_09240 [Spirochaetaceae bacterium]|nr:hypothetical protein [Spirochaetaceae bacterium]